MTPTMQLTDAQREAIRHGQPVHFVDSETSIECVLVRADLFEQVQRLLINDQPLSDQERLDAIRAAGLRAGWDDPELDVYEEYRKQT